MNSSQTPARSTLPSQTTSTPSNTPLGSSSLSSGTASTLRGQTLAQQQAQLAPAQTTPAQTTPAQTTSTPAQTTSTPAQTTSTPAQTTPAQTTPTQTTPAQATSTPAHPWKNKIDPSKAATFDNGGGHSYADHGAHTTEAQHRTRLATGKSPSGRSSPVPKTAPGSSKFDSDAQHESAIQAAAAILATKNPGPVPKKGINGKIGVSGAGTIYTRANTAEAATDVHVDIQVENGEYNLNTAFPTK